MYYYLYYVPKDSYACMLEGEFYPLTATFAHQPLLDRHQNNSFLDTSAMKGLLWLVFTVSVVTNDTSAYAFPQSRSISSTRSSSSSRYALLPKKTSKAPSTTSKTSPTTGPTDETKAIKPQRSLLKAVAAKTRPKSTFVSSEDDEESESASQQLAKLEAAANANKDELAAMLQAKLEEWKEMKAAGLLDRLKDLGEEGDSEVDYEQMVEALDQEMSSKRLLRRQRGMKKEDKKDGTSSVDGNSDDSSSGTGITSVVA